MDGKMVMRSVVKKVDRSFSVALQKARTGKGMSQKDLAGVSDK